jgi:hypothetical protein
MEKLNPLIPLQDYFRTSFKTSFCAQCMRLSKTIIVCAESLIKASSGLFIKYLSFFIFLNLFHHSSSFNLL